MLAIDTNIVVRLLTRDAGRAPDPRGDSGRRSLRAERPCAPTTPEEVFGRLNVKGKHAKSEDFANKVRGRAGVALSFLSF
jgi:hypothetical protein